jgi:hypothetical protein
MLRNSLDSSFTLFPPKSFSLSKLLKICIFYGYELKICIFTIPGHVLLSMLHMDSLFSYWVFLWLIFANSIALTMYHSLWMICKRTTCRDYLLKSFNKACPKLWDIIFFVTQLWAFTLNQWVFQLSLCREKFEYL